MAIRLSRENLPELAGKVAVPRYDAKRLKASIVHFGVGNFHRAHQAVYLDDLFNLGESQDWALIGAGVRAADEDMRQKLLAQDLLTTVVEQEAESSSARVTASMVEFLKPADTAAILGRLADPAIRIVSLTITEGGYYIDPATQEFSRNHPDIVADGKNLAAPKTVFGLILAGLARRRQRGVGPFTVMSCDNIPGNGHVTRHAVVGLASLADPELAGWVEEHVAFPNAMVDRITPATSDRERALLAGDFGVEDKWPVFCEKFRQWVLEDHFPAGRPALEKAGVQLVADVTPFEVMKIRILNGGHATIAYPAALMDIRFAHEAMANELIRRFLHKVEREEIIAIVPPVPGTDLQEYFSLIDRRFANPKIGDTIERLCQDGSNRQPKFIVPSVRDRLAAGGSVTGLALVSALWCRYCYGETDSGKPIAANDENWSRLTERAKAAKADPKVWLGMEQIYGAAGRNETFVAEFRRALNALWAQGTRATLLRYIGSEGAGAH